MNKKKLHFRHVMLYEFRKEIKKKLALWQKIFRKFIWTMHQPFERWRSGLLNFVVISTSKTNPGRPSVIDDDVLRTLTNNTCTTKEIAEALNIDRSTAFRHLKKMGLIWIWSSTLGYRIRCPKKISWTTSLQPILYTWRGFFLDRLMTGDCKNGFCIPKSNTDLLRRKQTSRFSCQSRVAFEGFAVCLMGLSRLILNCFLLA